MYDPIRRFYLKSQFAQNLNSLLIEKKQRRLSDQRSQMLSNAGLKVIDSKSVFARVSQKTNRVCHILGSGWSLLDSIPTISRDAFVIGMNFSALAEVRCDIYFVEFGGYSIESISKQQIRLFETHIEGKDSIVLFKNLWEQKNDPDFIIEFWGDRVEYIRDFAVQCPTELLLETAMNRLLFKDYVYLRQYRSTIITAIVFAYQAGFSQIVLHGIDFGGEYFFDLPEFSGDRSLRPPSNASRKLYGKKEHDSIHITSEGNLGVKGVLSLLGEKLKKNGVQLYSASTKSPLTTFFPVFSK
jgi:hypothetical protein